MGSKYIECLNGENILCRRAMWATNWWHRTKGLMFKRQLGGTEDIDGMLIDYCNSVHTFFMRFPLDLIFLSRDNIVIKVIQNKKPWRVTRFYWHASKVLELPVGMAIKVKQGDQIEVRNV